MMRRLASALGDLAILALPRTRGGWGGAMRAELDHIADDRSAARHAAGCIVAALKERTRDFETIFSAGIAGIALATGALAIFHVGCAARGVAVLYGRPDGFLAALYRTGAADPNVVADYRQAMPIVVACLFGLGIAHLVGVYFLLSWKLHRFLVACCVAVVFAVTAVSIQLSVVWTLDGVPSEFVALIIQSLALPIMLTWSNGRHKKLRRAE